MDGFREYTRRRWRRTWGNQTEERKDDRVQNGEIYYVVPKKKEKKKEKERKETSKEIELKLELELEKERKRSSSSKISIRLWFFPWEDGVERRRKERKTGISIAYLHLLKFCVLMSCTKIGCRWVLSRCTAAAAGSNISSLSQLSVDTHCHNIALRMKQQRA